jgi:hypothetical protein
MKTTVRYLTGAAMVLGIAAVRCGGSDEAAVVNGAGGAAGLGAAGGSSGSSVGGSGGVAGMGGAWAGGSSGASAGGNAGRGGNVVVDGGACPGSVPNDGDRCDARNQLCAYVTDLCTCRGNNGLSWRCIPVVTDAAIPRFDGNIPRYDSGFTIGDGGNPAGCPADEPQGGSVCIPGGSAVVCDYSGTVCVCARINGQSSWVCY